MNKVLPGLYVGNYRDSKDSTQLERFQITHIVAIHDAARKLHSDKHYLCVLASDTPEQNLTQYFPLCNDFIHAARLRGGHVLIHCLAGMSRSVTVAVAYIMSVTSLNWKEALKVVRAGRAVANPNTGFQKQLQEFEATRLTEERRRLKERFPSLALVAPDEEACRCMLRSYQSLVLSRDLCEGDCAMGQPCPTGMCRANSKRLLRRRSSSQRSTPPSSPRTLPPTPTSSRRPRSGPAGLHYYTASAPPSRSSSRLDMASLGVPSIAGSTDNICVGGSYGGLSAPTSPRSSPPVSPLHWPRRASTLAKRPAPS